MKELITRALTGAAYVALALLAGRAGELTTWLLYLPAVVLGTLELQRLLHPQGTGPLAGGTLALSTVLYAALGLAPLIGTVWLAGLVLTPLILLLLLITLALRAGYIQTGPQWMEWIAAPLYVAAPFALLAHLVHMSFGTYTLFLLMLWTNDTGAYLVGRALGRHKLLPKVSPGKTIEGLVGGVALVCGVAAWLGPVLGPERSSSTWIITGLGVALAGTLGDLLESAMKRAAGVKDSGHVLPGHGGILDRFDGLLLAAPTAWALLKVLP
ncbi:MAG: phosphatidate cytidylyltransferase [Flavobacteriales bacterium]|nr:phosphatidate cytidylyltransferase [Flavobacteriales bacterium]